MIHLLKIMFLACLACPLCVSAQWSQDTKRQFRTISIEQGLSQSTVYTIVQDDLGFMWMGTQDGLNRYDGNSFQVFRPDKANKTTIASSYIRSLLVDSRGVLWVGGNKGISSFNYVTESFHNYDLHIQAGEWFVSAINQDRSGTLWAATSAGDFYRWDSAGDNFQQVDLGEYSADINRVLNITQMDSLLLLSTNIGVLQFNPRQKKLSKFALDKKANVNYIAVDKEYVWMGTEGDGLFEYARNTKTIKQYKHIIGTTHTSLADNDVRSLEKDELGNLWIGTFKGLSILNIKTKSIQNYFQQSSVPHTLSQNSVRYIYRDKQNGMWMGTFYGGVSYFHNHDIRFSFLNRNTGNLSLNDNVVNVIKEDAAKNIWIGTNDKGLNFWDREQNVVRFYSHHEEDTTSLASNNIKAITFDNKGNVLVGTHNAGMGIFNPKTGKTIVFRHHPDDGSSIAGNMVYALLKDKAGRIWVGTRSGLDRFNESTQKFSHLYLDKKGVRLSSDEVTTLMEDSKGRIWIGTTNGVNILHPDQLVFEIFPGSNLSSDVITAIVEDKKRTVWVATREGLNYYDEKSKSFKVFDGGSKIEGLIYGMLSDDDGNLWLTTAKNLLRLNPENGEYQLFDDRDGLQISQFNLSAAEKTSDGILLFGGINGLTYFKPDQVMPKKLDLRLTFTGLEVLNKPVFAGDNHRILNQHIDRQESFGLNHDHKQFTIYFNTFDYISPNKITYRYRLEGFDENWIENRDVPRATYTNLKAGTYKFHVEAIGPLGETSAIRSITINISPPWWKSNWFFLIMAVFGAICVYVAYSVVTERMRTLHQLKMERLQREFASSKLHLERIEHEKIDSINKMKTDFFTNISHEFRTPLTLIISPLEELIGNMDIDKDIKRYHELMLWNAKRLYQLVDQLLEFRKAEAGTKKLKVARSDMVKFVREIYESFVTMAEKKNIAYTFICAEKSLLCSFDRDSIERICFNLLSNAFKYTKERGKLSISLYKKEEDLVIQVSDSGIGIPKEEQAQIFERFYQVDAQEINLGSGIGLAFTKKLVELHHGSIYLESELGKGAVFTVKIPYAEEYYTDEERIESQSVLETGRAVVSVEDSAMESSRTLPTITEQESELLLIVDDNPEIVDYLNNYFAKHYATKVAYNGREALEMLENNTFDLIISDVTMPEVDGIQLCKKIKQNINTCHIPVILLTAKSETGDQIQGLAVGADDYIAKPFSIAILDAKTQNILRSRKRLKEYYSAGNEIVPENIAFNAMDEEFLRQAIVIIETSMSDSGFSVDKFSKEIGMSRSNLYLKLKAITGESATDFIRRIRFKKAGELLQEKQYTVAQIAYMCGFNSPSYFSTAFKQYYGCMPSEYLEKNKPS